MQGAVASALGALGPCPGQRGVVAGIFRAVRLARRSRLYPLIWGAVMAGNEAFPEEWTGQQVVVTLPEHIEVATAAQVREQLLSVINRGAVVLILDMTATQSCDHAGVDAIVRGYQRAVISGTQLRVVARAPVVRRAIAIEGLDRLISIYPTLEAALAAETPGHPGLAASANGRRQPAQPEDGRAAIAPTVLWRLIDALGDGVVLTDDEGTIVAVNRRLTQLFGYEPAELAGRPVDVLAPADLRDAHRRERAAYARAPQARVMAERSRLVGLRRDGVTFPVEISLSPVPTATGHLILAVVRDATDIRRREDLADLARASVSEQSKRGQELLDRVVRSLFRVGLSLQGAADLPREVARERIAEALRELDETIHDIRDHAFSARSQDSPTDAQQ
jgi:anti-anti-sigma factor